jgi:maltose alpha-D-glucosyltransferase/alpha-amylase
MEWALTENPSLAIYVREHEGERVLVINNLSGTEQIVNLPSENEGEAIDLLTGASYSLMSPLTLGPYAYLWLKQNDK